MTQQQPMRGRYGSGKYQFLNYPNNMKDLNNDQAKAFKAMVEFVKTKPSKKAKAPTPTDTMFLLNGYAGTGKTYTISRFIQHYSKNNEYHNIAVTAPTNKAVNVLRSSSQLGSKPTYCTIHSLLGLKEKIDNRTGEQLFVQDPINPAKITGIQLLIIDEVSMLHDDLFHMIRAYAGKIKIIMMGDPAQIPPVGKRDCLPFLEPTKYNIITSQLSEIMRQKKGSQIIDLSFTIRNNIDLHADFFASITPTPDSDVQMMRTIGQDGIEKAFHDLYLSDAYKDNSDHVKAIAWSNRKTDEINDYVRGLIYGPDRQRVMQGEKMIAGSPILQGNPTDGMDIIITTNQEFELLSYKVAQLERDGCRYNCYMSKVMYVDPLTREEVEHVIPIMHEDSEALFKANLQVIRNSALNADKGTRGYLWKKYYGLLRYFADARYAYAVTAHKAQGSTYGNVLLIADNIMQNPNVVERNRIMYTAVTRAKDQLIVVSRG